MLDWKVLSTRDGMIIGVGVYFTLLLQHLHFQRVVLIALVAQAPLGSTC